jgi:S-DNA-T family DNA segregation ATPase FtsK/SpoIIIE
MLPPFLLFASDFLKKNRFNLIMGACFFSWGLAIFISLLLNRTGLGGGGFMGGFFAKMLYKISGLVGGYGASLILMAYGISKSTGAFTLKKVFENTLSKAKTIKDIASSKASILERKQTAEEDIPAFIEKKIEEAPKVIESETLQVEETVEEAVSQDNNADCKAVSFGQVECDVEEDASGELSSSLQAEEAFLNGEADELEELPEEIVRQEEFPCESLKADDEKKGTAAINITEERIILFADEKEAMELYDDVTFIKEKLRAENENQTAGFSSALSKVEAVYKTYETAYEKSFASSPLESSEDKSTGRYNNQYSPSIEMLDDDDKSNEDDAVDVNEEDFMQDDVSAVENYVDFTFEVKERRENLRVEEDASPNNRVEKVSPEVSVFRNSGKLITDLPNPFTKYKKPPMDILFFSKETNLEDAKEELEETADKIIETFREFKITLTKLIACYRGPVITRYEFEIAPGIRMEKIERFSNNIAYSLAAKKVRIIAPIFGKQAIGVEVPNQKRKNVHLGDILKTKMFETNNKNNLPIALGKDISGEPVIADLSTMPHLLIAGTTGSGKSVCINSILCSLLYNNRPEELRFILIDPKRVELKTYDNIPHLLAPVITDAKKASMALNWAVNEMERRYEILEESGSRDIKTYNEKFDKNELNPIVNEGRLHYIVIIIDEMADLMLVAKKEIESVVARLAAKARAAGIHLIFATQSPRADIITGVIKANFQPRIAFAVATKMESRIILDVGGADKLLGKGDMLFYQPGFVEEGTPVRLQGAFISDKEVLKLTGFLGTLCGADYAEDMFYEEDGDYGVSTMSESDEPVYREAVKIVTSDKKASASYLQRRMQIGYNRAARMIEYMEQEGIVGKANGSKPREVLVDDYPY